ncbi:hypothetical protein RJI07_00625 [Mycoplasmatota bacterium WC30]
MRKKILYNILSSPEIIRKFMEYNDKRCNRPDEIDEFEVLVFLYDFFKIIIIDINYNEDKSKQYNAILCSIESFLDYLDEFIFLYANNRFTVVSHTARACFEAFLASMTILTNTDGIDILMNNSDKQEKIIDLDGITAYGIGKKELVEKKYNKRLSERTTKKTMKIIDLVSQLSLGEEYGPKDLYIFYRFLSKESHFNLECEFAKREVELGGNIRIKTQMPTISGYTLPLHLNIITLKLIRQLLEFYNISPKYMFKK